MISLRWNLIFKNDVNEFIHKTETDSQILKTNLWLVTKVEMQGGGINQKFEINIYTLLYKIDNEQEGTLLNIL